jgi:hypothetical protein
MSDRVGASCRYFAAIVLVGLFTWRVQLPVLAQGCPGVALNPIDVLLNANGWHTLTPDEIRQIAGGTDPLSGLQHIEVTPSSFGFCDRGPQSVQVQFTDTSGVTRSCAASIRVIPDPDPPQSVYVDASYPRDCRSVEFLDDPAGRSHWSGYDAFPTIQEAVNRVAEAGCVYVAAGTYAESVTIPKPLKLLGPNRGLPGDSAQRGPEAKVIPGRNDPENSPIISVESDQVVIDGLELDGSNPSLPGGYRAPGTTVHAAAGVQNGIYPDLADVQGISICNNVITNISYDGICLDRYLDSGTSSAWNYIEHNKLTSMWEGILTYAVDAIITDNVISNVTHGLGVHCVTTAAPRGFVPLVASNRLSIAEWWPAEIEAVRVPGIWINFRRDEASPMEVVGNVVTTPVAVPGSKTVIGYYALTVDGNGRVDFRDNTLNGEGNCSIGLLAVGCWSNRCVNLSGGALRGVCRAGVLADTFDTKWGAANTFVTVSNVEIELLPSATGVAAVQEPTTPSNTVSVEVRGSNRIHGGAQGIQVVGTKASATIIGERQLICDNDIGIDVQGGRALIEGNVLTNNRTAAIAVEQDGIVDAGDCVGLDITGLGSGSGLRGASAGLNDLSGYGFDRIAPWAIRNSGAVPVVADHNAFTPTGGEPIEAVIFGPVQFSQSGALNVSGPPTVQVECLRAIPVAARTVDEFVAAGGAILSGTPTTVNAEDMMETNRPGSYRITRTYTLSGGCSQPVQVQQTIAARDDQPPVLQCSGNLVQGVDPKRDYATVTFTNLAVDSCGELLGSWAPTSTGQFKVGTNHVIVIATDLANNSTVCSFDIAVIPLPRITLQPKSCTNDPGTTASFAVAATSLAPMTFEWKKNGLGLAPSQNYSGVQTPQLTIKSVSVADEGDYTVEVSNLAGTVTSSPARLTVRRLPGLLKVLEVSQGVVKLAVQGTPGWRVCVSTSTNLKDWIVLRTDSVPFILTHTNTPGPGCRFYRGLPVP